MTFVTWVCAGNIPGNSGELRGNPGKTLFVVRQKPTHTNNNIKLFIVDGKKDFAVKLLAKNTNSIIIGFAIDKHKTK